MTTSAYWRVLFDDIVQAAYLEFAEIEMRATAGGADQCSGGTASASDVFSTYVAANAVDDNIGTWFIGDGGDGQWWRYDFASPVEVIEIAFWPRGPTYLNYNFSQARLQRSDDLGSTWVDVATFYDTGVWTNAAWNVYTAAIVTAPPGVLNFSGSAAISSAVLITALPGVLNFSGSAVPGLGIISAPGVLNFSGSAIGGVGATALPGVLNFSGDPSPVGIGATALPGVLNFSGSAVPGLGIISVPGVLTFSGSSSGGDTITLTGGALYYRCKLTGANDGVDDVYIPISSFQTRKRSGNPTYLQVVAPGVGSAADIVARPNGRLQVYSAYKFEGAFIYETLIADVDLDGVSITEGTRSRSIVLDGSRTETFYAKTLTIENAAVKTTDDGSVKYEVREPPISLNPGDTVTIGTNTFVAAVVVYMASISASGRPKFTGYIQETE